MRFAQVLKQESLALDLLSRSTFPLDQFVRQYAASNNLIVTGMGKSGIIAHKVASTFTSLGEPAIYLDAGAALHGEMGIIQSYDLVIMFSKSGNTFELRAVIDRANAVGAYLVAITAKPNSYLGQHARVLFQLPDFDEACHLNLAPTTSTTMMLALGDALAVQVAENMAFTEKDFLATHPGGTLGGIVSRTLASRTNDPDEARVLREREALRRGIGEDDDEHDELY